MKPHIKKLDGYWYCFDKIRGNHITYQTAANSPRGAYFRWLNAIGK